MGKPWGSVMIGVRREKVVVGHFFDNWTRFLIGGGLRPGDVVGIAQAKPAHMAANELGRKLLKSKCDSLLFIDSDASFDIEALEHLRVLQEGWEYDILQAFYTTRSWPQTPLWIKLDEKGKMYRDEVRHPAKTEPLHAVGFHFTLIRRAVLEKMAHPWFYYAKEGGTEDVPFCVDAAKAGFKIGATTKVKTRHWGEYPFGWREYQDTLDQEAAGVKRIPPVDIVDFLP